MYENAVKIAAGSRFLSSNCRSISATVCSQNSVAPEWGGGGDRRRTLAVSNFFSFFRCQRGEEEEEEKEKEEEEEEEEERKRCRQQTINRRKRSVEELTREGRQCGLTEQSMKRCR